MEKMVEQFIDQFGYLGVFLLIALENIFPPIPSELILTFSGFLTLHSNMNIIGVIIAATLGSVFGAIVLYFIGRFLSIERLQKLANGKTGKILRFKASDLDKATGWFDNHGKKIVFFARFIPVIRSLISIPAGTTNMPLISFLILTTLGTLIWNTVLVILGQQAGEAWPKISAAFDSFSSIVLIVLIILLIIGIIYFVKKRFSKSKYD
ncbi:DedA family protein [Staphylococcus carnosus]|uniref:Alkaline phosphatase like protein n=2 Tax=Staphylococcus carnosus TaxID=1281 RepID=B9DKR1_STACT|nr:DedA family protein [Staphylococcus carnosus]ANZ34118.1 alkaline phosphatase [Staphylococcus carnosus]KKB25184.1 alkaline phosphatase [Staphylococcus carnosus]KOR14314.1 alkaline phosphatase [Staphylococcus carnosus]POA07856.1 DedA family protein [Staphylococcus carnosus]QPT03337.1 DedA family protein [Staphylococcus carnosus]